MSTAAVASNPSPARLRARIAWTRLGLALIGEALPRRQGDAAATATALRMPKQTLHAMRRRLRIDATACRATGAA